MPEVVNFDTPELLAQGAADLIINLAEKDIANNDRFTIALSGGNTPATLYALLATASYSSKINWKKVFIFWGDERCVTPDNEDNNSFNAKRIFLDHVSIPKENIFPIPVELPPAKAAAQYEDTIKQFFGTDTPEFDLVLLGMGDNGHTASLFPHSEILKEEKALVKEVYVAEVNMWRISFTAKLINNAKHILFLVAGNEKKQMLQTVLHGKYEPERYPAQLIKGAKWFVSIPTTDNGNLIMNNVYF